MSSGVSGGLLTDRIGVGVVTRVVPRDVVDEVLLATGRREKRRRLLPARVVVYFVLAMSLFFDDAYEEIIRKLVWGLDFLGVWRKEWSVPTTGAVSQARARLGEEPLRELFQRVAVPVARPGTTGAWLGSLRLMAIDGTMFDVADTPGNAAEFGRYHGCGVVGPFPQARVVGLLECGTHAVVAAGIGGIGVGEHKLARELLPFVETDMLVMADRGFYGLQLWTEFLDTGAELLWRVPSSVHLPVHETFADGSYRSVLATARAQRLLKNKTARDLGITEPDGLAVRVIEYEITNRETRGERIRLITSITDPTDAPAMELAAAYHQRWEIEISLAELKTTQRGGQRVLRSKSPEMVRQEIWGLLLTHYAIRALIREAADDLGEDPDRISFIRSLRVIRRQVSDQAAFSPSTTQESDDANNP